MEHLPPCPYCQHRALVGPQQHGLARCRECGTHCRRRGRAWQIVTCPDDERKWVVRFLPRLRELRRLMRPGSRHKAIPLAPAALWDRDLDG